MKTITNIIHLPFTLLAFACFALSPQSQAANTPNTPDPGPLPISNTADGQLALAGVTGLYNSAFGIYALLSNGAASFNTGVGADVLLVNTENEQTAVGAAVLFSNTTGANNTGVGAFGLFFNGTANNNTAVGHRALENNDVTAAGLANGNTAVGAQALNQNIDGSFNAAVGGSALFTNTNGFSNNAFGNSALFFNTIASENTAIGDVALAFNDSSGAGLGNNNTAVGGFSLFNNVDGSENTALGTGVGQNVITGFNNTYVGNFVGTGVGDESSTIRINDLSGGNAQECFIGGIFNNFQPVGGSVVEVTLDLANDHLGWDVGPNQGGSAPSVPSRNAPLRRSAPGAPTQRPAMLNGTVGKVEKLEATVAQQQKQIETL
ncbi:MAG: hypothetical protein DMF20_12095, partial [Verrucomicrobia bacterium]